MPSHRRPSVSTSAVWLLALTLAACGGGGGGGGGSADAPPVAGAGPAPSPAPAPATAASAAAPQASSPTASTPEPPPAPGQGSACAGDDAPVFRSISLSLLNMVRSALSLPPFERLPAFDETAQAHARYTVVNGGTVADETPGRPCFSGATLVERLAAVGVVASAQPGARPHSEIVIAYVTPAGVEVQPWDLMNDTLHSLYSRLFVLDPRTQQIGLGFSTLPGTPQRALVLDTALLPDTAGAPADTWVVWPRDGATDLPTRMRAANLKPLDASITEGYPVTLHARSAVQIGRFLLTRASDGAAVAATVVTQANDRNAFLSAGEAALVPHAPLDAGTTYRVELEATVGATPRRLVWSFTTAP